MQKINSKSEVEEYLNHEKIECLNCGKRFSFLPVHINRVHQLTASEYRALHNLPAGTPLAGLSYRAKHSEKIRKMILENILTHDHLPTAVNNAIGAERAKRKNYDLENQALLAKKIPRPELPAGAKRADGRDADKAREYQREYRAKRKKELAKN